MKILHIIDSLGLGGAQTVVKGIFEYQPKNSNIFLLALRKREITTEIKHPNIIIFNSTKKYSLKPLFEIKKIIKKNNIDILHCHLFRSQFFGWLLKKIWFKDLKLIFHEHGEIFQGHFLYNLFMRLSKNHINKIIAVSKTTKEELIKKVGFSEDKICVLSNFVDLQKFSRKKINWNIDKEREKLGIKKYEFVIGFIGRLDKVKGCEYLIKSLAFLEFPFKLLIAGDGPESKYLKELAKKLKVNNKIIFLGYRDDVFYIYSFLDVLVVPSLFESFGSNVVEAQAMRVPVVVSNIGGLKELVNDENNGLLFNSKNKFELAKKINLIYNNYKLRISLLEKAFENVKKFSLNKYVKNIEKMYENIK